MKWTSRSLGLLGMIGVLSAAICAAYVAGTELAFGNGNDLNAPFWFIVSGAVLVHSLVATAIGDSILHRDIGGEQPTAGRVTAGPESTELVVPPSLTLVQEDGSAIEDRDALYRLIMDEARARSNQ